MNNIVMLPKKEYSPFYMKMTRPSIHVDPLGNLIPTKKTLMTVLVDGKPSTMEFNEAQMDIIKSFKNKTPSKFKRFMNWIADNFFFTNNIQFVRKHAGGRWEKWFVGGRICKFMWFRGHNSDVADLTDEGLPLLRAMMNEENWN